jgi:nitroreductase
LIEINARWSACRYFSFLFVANFHNANLMTPITSATTSSRVLPSPRTEGGSTLVSALRQRESVRAFSETPLDTQVLSDLLWCACGVNRADGGRTSPFWRDIVLIDVYVATADGVDVYNPESNSLRRHLDEDIRAKTGIQDFVSAAPVNLIYVARGNDITDLSTLDRRLYASVCTGFIGQNVYLYCASAGLGSVFRNAIDYPMLEKLLRLPAGQFVTFAQSVGYPRVSGHHSRSAATDIDAE